MDHPHLVRAVHDDFFAAGADVATTNSYAVLRDRLQPAGLEDQFEALLSQSVELAKAAVKAHGSGQVAGSIGPLKASYRPDLFPALKEAIPVYEEKIAALGGVDFLIAETVASLAHAEAVLAAAGDNPIWIAVTVDDEDGTKLRSGELVADLAPLIAKYIPDSVLANCSAPEAVDQVLPVLRSLDRPFGAYANGFTEITKAFLGERPTVDALSAREDITPERYAGFAERWADGGATIIGGCCEIGPAHIAELKRRLG